MDILIFSLEAGRCGPARLPEAFAKAGLSTAALCPADDLLARSRFLERLFPLPQTRSEYRLAASLASAIAAGQPKLIVPADEQAVLLLQGFARGRCASRIGMPARELILRSLGDPAGYDAALFKQETLDLARARGIAVPAGRRIHSPADAASAAHEIGYPVYVKRDLSWAGTGVSECRDEAAVLRCAVNPPQRLALLRRLVRRALGRAWYPDQTEISVQGAVSGDLAMVCALAWQGRTITTICARKLASDDPTGPSTVVRMAHCEDMAAAARSMIEGLGCSGFVGFDFILEADTGRPVLLECNPRPIPITHLGAKVGVDLAQALSDVLRGETPAEVHQTETALDVALFSFARHAGAMNGNWFADIPYDDPGLIAHFAEPQRRDATPATRPLTLQALPSS